MELVDSLFSIARQITDGQIDDVNKLHEKAKNEVITYHSGMKGYKGMYAKIHKGWFFQLGLIFATPFVTTWLLSKKQQIMNKASLVSQNPNMSFDDEDDYEDEDDLALFEELKQKYGGL